MLGIAARISGRPIAAVLAVGVGLALAGATAGEASAAGSHGSAAGHPNFVLLVTHDQAVSDLRAMPHTRRLLAGGGVTFAKAFGSYPVCCASRAAFLSGRYAHNHGLNSSSVLAAWLEDAGYATGRTEWHTAVELIERDAGSGRPFFLSVASLAHQSPLPADEAVAAIVGALRRTGELDNTYILFTSDNGYMQRVPLLLRGPGVPRGRVSHELVGSIDLAPTIVEVADARPAAVIDGRSLLPFARDPDQRSNRPLLYETGGRGYRAVRTPRWLYVEYRKGGRGLYDLREDPRELHSLAAEPNRQAVVAVLQRVLRRLATCRGAACRRALPTLREPAPIEPAH